MRIINNQPNHYSSLISGFYNVTHKIDQIKAFLECRDIIGLSPKLEKKAISIIKTKDIHISLPRIFKFTINAIKETIVNLSNHQITITSNEIASELISPRFISNSDIDRLKELIKQLSHDSIKIGIQKNQKNEFKLLLCFKDEFNKLGLKEFEELKDEVLAERIIKKEEKNITNAHETRIKAGEELIQLYLLKKDIDSLYKLATNEKVNGDTRIKAGEILIGLDKEKAIDTFYKLATDYDGYYDVRLEAVKSLIEIDKETAIDVLYELASDNRLHGDIRLKAGELLIELDKAKAKDAIYKLAKYSKTHIFTRLKAGDILFELYVSEKDIDALFKLTIDEKIDDFTKIKAMKELIRLDKEKAIKALDELINNVNIDEITKTKARKLLKE